MSEENKKDVQENKALAAVSYIWILCLLPIIVGTKSKFAMHHAKQGLVLFIAEIALWIVSIIPVIGWLIGFIGFILAIIVSILGIVKALAGEYWQIPYIGKFADKIKL